MSPGPGDTVVIIDGLYHQAASVRHKEILHLLSAGVTVVGCSSMGALRAAELHPFGMAGSGRIFEMYRDGVIDADDEVAVAHGEAPEYRRLSLPLVNVRFAAMKARQSGAVTAEQARAIVAAARAVPYTIRSWPAIDADGVGAVRDFLSRHPEHGDLKAADAIATLRRLDAFGPLDPRRHDWVASTGWRSGFLHQWRVEFNGTLVEGVHVGDEAAMRYRQIYEPGFPGRWRDHVLTVIAGSPSPKQALAVAESRGIVLTGAQREEWLTTEESGRMTPAEAMLTILVRSHRTSGGAYGLVAAEGDGTTEAHRRAVAESYAINAEVAGWDPGRSIGLLKHATLRDHLAMIWGVTGQEDLRAAARDRGFGALRYAVRAVRPFYLRHHFAMAEA